MKNHEKENQARSPPSFPKPFSTLRTFHENLFNQESKKMQTIEAKVRGRVGDAEKAKELGSVTIPVYETLDEAIADVGEGKILALYNKQSKTDIMNNFRQQYTGKPKKDAIRAEALSRITPEEFAACGGDSTEIVALMAQKSEEVEAEYAAKQAASLPASAEADEEAEEEAEEA